VRAFSVTRDARREGEKREGKKAAGSLKVVILEVAGWLRGGRGGGEEEGGERKAIWVLSYSWAPGERG